MFTDGRRTTSDGIRSGELKKKGGGGVGGVNRRIITIMMKTNNPFRNTCIYIKDVHNFYKASKWF